MKGDGMTVEEALSRRGQEYREASAAEQRAREERDAYQRRVDQLDADLTGMRGRRAELAREIEEALAREIETGESAFTWAEKLRAELADLDRELSHTEALRQTAFTTLHTELHPAHSVAFMALSRARVALTREPCEEALQAILDVFRQLEAAWEIAGAEAQRMDRAGDSWGLSQISRLRAGLMNQNAWLDGSPYHLRLPVTWEEV